jgi:hypothetical protein
MKTLIIEVEALFTVDSEVNKLFNHVSYAVGLWNSGRRIAGYMNKETDNWKEFMNAFLDFLKLDLKSIEYGFGGSHLWCSASNLRYFIVKEIQ